MRTLTAVETAALAAPNRRFHLRCQIKDSGGTWRDTSTLNGWQWLVSAEVNEDVDAFTASARISLRKGGPGKDSYLSTAPGMETSPINTLSGSYNPLVALFREIRLDLAIMPQDATPASGDWKLWFHGRIDTYDSAGEEVVIEARDLGGYLADCFIEVEREYSTGGATPVQTLIQSILTDNLVSITVPTLRTIGTPGWSIERYKQQRMPVMEAIQEIAQQNGWALRYLYDSSAGDFKLTYSQPNRTATTGVITLSPADYWDVQSVTQHVAGVRNVVQVWYWDALDLDSALKPKRKSVSSTADAAQTASIAKYGRRWMQLVEDSSSLVDSPAEAQTYCDAITADLREPLVDLTVEARLLPHVELGDMITFQANGAHFTSDQTLAVVGFSHTIGPMDQDGNCPERTNLRLRGKPVAKWRGWLDQDAGRAGYLPSAEYLSLPAPSSVVATAVLNGVKVTFLPPTDPRRDWRETELHLSTTSGFTPSNATLVARTTTSMFEVMGLTPGINYYGRLISKDSQEVQSTPSGEFTFVPLFFEVSLVDTSSTDISRWPLNGNFLSWSGGIGAPPDQWSMASGTWSSTTVYRDDRSVDGPYSIIFKPLLAGTIHSSYIPVTPNVVYQARMQWLKTVAVFGGAGTPRLGIDIAWYDSSKTLISTISAWGIDVEADPNPIETWKPMTTTSTSPTTAKYARVRIVRSNVGVVSTGDVCVDDVEFVARALQLTTTGATMTPTANWTDSLDSKFEYDTGTILLSGSVGATAGAGGATVGTLVADVPKPAVTTAFPVIQNGVVIYITISTTGVITLSGSWVVSQPISFGVNVRYTPA